MEKKCLIEIEVYESIYISENMPMLGKSVFLGDALDPVYEVDKPLDSVFEKYIAENSIPNGTVTEKHRQELLDGLELIKNLIDEKINKVK
jgi:hypothetical protein